MTGNNQKTFAFVGNDPNLATTSSFIKSNAYSLFVTEDFLVTILTGTNRNVTGNSEVQKPTLYRFNALPEY